MTSLKSNKANFALNRTIILNIICNHHHEQPVILHSWARPLIKNKVIDKKYLYYYEKKYEMLNKRAFANFLSVREDIQ